VSIIGSITRRPLAAVAMAAAASAVTVVSLAAPGDAAQVAARTAAPQCQPGGAVVWLDTQSNGAAGTIYYSLKITNLSGRSCRMFGYPGVSAVSLRGTQLGAPASRALSSVPERTITLRTGQTATAYLGIHSVINVPRASCRPVTAAGLRVYLPGRTVSKIVPYPFQTCSARGQGSLSISPVIR